MNRNKKGVMPEITREIYKGVKKFDRQQFTNFCTDLYKFGFEDGKASVPAIDINKIYEVIASTKGIGPKKLDEIKANLEMVYGVVEHNGKENNAEDKHI